MAGFTIVHYSTHYLNITTDSRLIIQMFIAFIKQVNETTKLNRWVSLKKNEKGENKRIRESSNYTNKMNIYDEVKCI